MTRTEIITRLCEHAAVIEEIKDKLHQESAAYEHLLRDIQEGGEL